MTSGTRSVVIWRTELVDQPLRPLSLLHDSLLVILPEGSGQLVEVHGWPILPLAPQVSHLSRIHDLEDTLGMISPVYATCRTRN